MELEQHQLALAQRQRGERLAHGRPALDLLVWLTHVTLLGAPLVELAAGFAPAFAQLVEGCVARDREQPRARRAPARVEAGASAVQPLERQRGHVLGRRTVAQQRDRVAVHIACALAKQRVEGGVVEALASPSRAALCGRLIAVRAHHLKLRPWRSRHHTGLPASLRGASPERVQTVGSSTTTGICRVVFC